MMNLDQASSIPDCSPETVRLVVTLLELSRSPEQLIYREAELDELIREIEMMMLIEDSEALRKLLAAAFDAHELVANARPIDAAERLREASL
jgi:hypothetical protein